MSDYKIANIIGVIKEDKYKYIKVRSLESAEYCKRHGVMHEWLVNEYTFTREPEMTKLRFGIDDAEYDRLLAELRNE